MNPYEINEAVKTAHQCLQTCKDGDDREYARRQLFELRAIQLTMAAESANMEILENVRQMLNQKTHGDRI